MTKAHAPITKPPIKLHNTMTRQLAALKPIHEDTVSLYTCGPTVYNYAQLGNWATYIRWDALVRMLHTSGYDVRWVMNITDVGHLTSDADEGEDKLEKGARREGKTAWEVADFYTKDFLAGMQQLAITKPTFLVKATDHIKEQIRFVTKLEAKGFTYRIDDGIYFDTSKLPDYGKLARLKLDALRAGARVTLNEQKRNPTDFAVWKLSPAGSHRDMEWDSPWGKGFPGWHLECSVLAMQYLGETLDIHAGGIDHIPVHHTNEIAQSEVVTGKPFANLWLHSNFITVDGVKLSKSLGNSYNLHDVIARGYEPLALRLLFLQSHYRSEADFTWQGLDAAVARLNAFRAMADVRWQARSNTATIDTPFNDAQAAMLAALQNDLNTPEALAVLSGVEQYVAAAHITREQLPAFDSFLTFVDQTLGLSLLASTDITEEQKALIKKREVARHAKDYAASDAIRMILTRQGILVRDTPHGPVWSRQ